MLYNTFPMILTWSFHFQNLKLSHQTNFYKSYMRLTYEIS